MKSPGAAGRSEDLGERVAALEVRVEDLEKGLDARTARDRWVVGTLIGLAAVVASVVALVLQLRGA